MCSRVRQTGLKEPPPPPSHNKAIGSYPSAHLWMGSLGWKLTDYSSSSDASQYRMHECSSTLYSYFPFTHNFLKYDYWLMEGPFPRYISFTSTRRWSSYLPFWRSAIVWEGFDLLRYCISPNVVYSLLITSAKKSRVPVHLFSVQNACTLHHAHCTTFLKMHLRSWDIIPWVASSYQIIMVRS